MLINLSTIFKYNFVLLQLFLRINDINIYIYLNMSSNISSLTFYVIIGKEV